MEYRKNIEKFLGVMTGKTFVKNAIVDESTGTLFVNFYDSFDEYKKDNPNSLHTDDKYNNYFGTGRQIEKIIIIESARILRDHLDIDTVSMTLKFNGKEYISNISRDEMNNEIGFDIRDLSPENNTWHDKFLNIYGTGLKNEKRSRLFKKFVEVYE